MIPLLQKAGLHVTSVQNPLTSFADDVAATRRALALQDGPTVLVGHSYAGMIVSETGTDPKVSALVYLAARAPDAGEDYPALAAKFPAPPASKGLVHHDGFAELSEDAFVHNFAGDLPAAKARALYAVQGPISDKLFASKTTQAAWHTKPSCRKSAGLRMAGRACVWNWRASVCSACCAATSPCAWPPRPSASTIRRASRVKQ